VETRQRDTLKSEANLEITVEHDEAVKWIGEGLPAAFTMEVLDIIMKKLIEGGYVGVGVDVWKDANLHAKEAPRNDSEAQACKVTWLNGLLEEVRRTLYFVQCRQ